MVGSNDWKECCVLACVVFCLSVAHVARADWILYDDFNSGVIDTTKWNPNAEDGGVLPVAGDGGVYLRGTDTNGWPEPSESALRLGNVPTEGMQADLVFGSLIGSADFAECGIEAEFDNGNYAKIGFAIVGSSLSLRAVIEDAEHMSVASKDLGGTSFGAVIRIGIVVTDTAVEFYDDGALVWSYSGTFVISRLSIEALAVNGTFDCFVDDVYIASEAPDRPICMSPADGATGVSLTPLLQASPFSDPDVGDTHQVTIWWVDNTNDFTNLEWNYIDSDSDKTSESVPSNILSNGTLYYWKVRYQDNRGLWSEWSSPYSFTTAPALPLPAINPSPSNGLGDQSVNVDLSWSNGGGATSYDVYFGANNPPAFQGNQSATMYDPGTLSYSTTYYWQVNARNSAGVATGDVWSFTTETGPIQPPLPAVNLSPSNGATNQSVNVDLSWSNGGEATSYDVYFGANNPPAFQANQSATTYDPGILDYSTTYYWRVDARNSAGSTTGDVWSFSTEPEGSGAVSVVNLAQLTDGPYWESEPAFNADGTMVAYRNAHGALWYNCDIWTMDVDGSDQTQVTTDAHGEFNPRYSPDERVMYTKEFGSNDYDLWVIDADGLNAHEVVTGSLRQMACSWHPSGNKLIYCNEYTNNAGEIWQADSDGSSQVGLTDHTTDGYNQSTPIYSRSGETIAYVNYAESGADAHIWVMNADGTDKQQITFETGNQYPVFWWPQDSSIGYTQDGELWLHDLDTDTNRQILKVSNATIGWADLSPDGTKVVFELSDASGSHVWIGDVISEPQTLTLHDWNGDGIVSIVGDVPPFVDCVYFQNCPSGVDTIAVGDCNGDGILSIVGDVPCFVDCVYFDNCEE